MLTHGPFSGPRIGSLARNPGKMAHSATHNATHDKDDLHVLRKTYAAVRDLQVVECIRQPHSEKAGVGGSTPSLATTFCKHLATSSHPGLAPIGSTILVDHPAQNHGAMFPTSGGTIRARCGSGKTYKHCAAGRR
jgi:hypothetical protein